MELTVCGATNNRVQYNYSRLVHLELNEIVEVSTFLFEGDRYGSGCGCDTALARSSANCVSDRFTPSAISWREGKLADGILELKLSLVCFGVAWLSDGAQLSYLRVGGGL